ncbi:MAG TPA: ribbon-helix-helix protein, CopG family [Acidimicrobiia bacterium]|nr:ribbon-helix-helix protein, CopG family [Acidimicrobiia bacterium]
MSQAISVRLDDESLQALRKIESTGLSRSEAIRSAVINAAAGLRRRESLAAEVAALAAGPDDRAEMTAIAEFMDAISAEG